MLKIGITGGIGSGKTTVCKIFECFGIPVYYADDRAKQLIANHPALKKNIIAHFGPDAYDADGNYNRTYMANIVFSDKKKLEELNNLVHPIVAEDGLKWMLEHREAPYILKEAALLFESGSYRELDRIIFVSAPQELKISRVIARDHVDKEAVLKRIENQWSDKEKQVMSQEIICNDGTQSLIKQVHQMHHRFLQIKQKQ